jgi:hypothetical protein
MAKGTEVATK